MNEARVRRLATEGQVEVTVKMFRRLSRKGISLTDMAAQLGRSEMKDENVFAYPDFACLLGLPGKDRDADLVCVQTPDGRTVRIVGYIDNRKPARVTPADDTMDDE
jgi:hypothetical protein